MTFSPDTILFISKDFKTFIHFNESLYKKCYFQTIQKRMTSVPICRNIMKDFIFRHEFLKIFDNKVLSRKIIE